MNWITTLIKGALCEDVGSGDITAEAVIGHGRQARARIVAKEDLVVCGTFLLPHIFHAVDRSIKVKIKRKDGSPVGRGGVIAELKGPVAGLLSAERTALNFMQRLTGIATLTAGYVKALKGTAVKILDTRKTTPGFRLLEKYAVRTGGGHNHRMGLFDMYLIKNNHIDMVGSVTEAVLRAKYHRKLTKVPIEVEVRNINELNEAVSTGADIIMLDNFSPKKAKKAIFLAKKLAKLVGNSPKFEISGGINLKNIKKYANSGADYISVGALTHSARAADIHMIIEQS